MRKSDILQNRQCSHRLCHPSLTNPASPRTEDANRPQDPGSQYLPAGRDVRLLLYIIKFKLTMDSVCIFGVIRCVALSTMKSTDLSCTRPFFFLIYILTIYRQRSLLGNLVIHRNIRRDRRRMHADAAPAVQEQEQRVEICRRQCIQLERVFCTLEIQSGSVFGVERDG